MTDRLYHLYSKGTGPYELVPTGYSALVAILGPFWALANGLLVRFVLLCLPLIPLAVLADLVHMAFVYVGYAYFVGVYFFYFPHKAYAWRGQVLQSKGFTLRATVNGVSAQDALRKYAESVPSSGA